MDNPNPVAKPIEELNRQGELRFKQRQSKNLWVSDLTPYFEASPETLAKEISSSVVKGELAKIESLNRERDEFLSEEIFELIRNLTDPEHPLTLEQLSVVSPELITVDNDTSTVRVFFTPTIPHCSQATIIGLMIRVKLFRSLPHHFKIDVLITPGSHNTEDAINKQLNDKERVAAALENPAVLQVINRGVVEELNCWSII